MRCLALGVLSRLASALQAVLLALLLTRVTRHQAVAAQLRLQGLVEVHQGAGDAVRDGAGPAGSPTAGDLRLHAELARLAQHRQRPHGDLLQYEPGQSVLQGAAVNYDLGGTRVET